jgi:hypothetical protein
MMNMQMENHQPILQRQHMNEHASRQCCNVSLSFHDNTTVPTLDVADFEILTVLGCGSFSEVLLVQDKNGIAEEPRKELALKR